MIEMLYRCLDNEDGLVSDKPDDGLGNAGAPGIDEDEDGEMHYQGTFYCATGFLEEKTAAALALENFARYLGPGYQKCWEVVFQGLLDCMSYPHPMLKQQVTRAMHYTIVNIMETLKAGACTSPEIVSQGEDCVKMIVTILLVNVAREDDKDCCVETLVSLAQLLKIDSQAILGLNGQNPAVLMSEAQNNQGAVDTNWPEFIEIVTLLLQEEAVCQAPDDVELAKRDVEDNMILDGITDVTSSLCENLHEIQLVEYWKIVFPLLPRYLEPNRSHIEYSLSIGTMGDVSSKLSPETIQPFLKDSVEMAFKGLNTSKHHLVRQNSVFALGCLCRAAQGSMTPYLENVVKVFTELCKLPRNDPDKKTRLLRDNAHSSLGSLLAYCSDSFADEIFQQLVETFLKGLPIEEDHAENEHVARNVLRLIERRQKLMQPYMIRLQTLLHHSLEWKEMPNDLVADIRNILGMKQQAESAI